MSSRLAFRNWPIKQKIGISFLLFIAFVVAIMFTAYVYQYRQEKVTAYVERAKLLTLATESAREQAEAQWKQGIFTIEMIRQWVAKGELDKALGSVPVVVAWRTAALRAKEGNYVFKVPKFHPRNPKNEPDAFEARALEKIKADGLTDYYAIDPSMNSVRYLRAVKLSQSCLICHGDPATSRELWGNNKGLDPTGGPMENWKEGEIHGAFEVIYSLDQADADINRNLGIALGFAALVLLIGAFMSWRIGVSLARPIAAAVDAIQTTSRGDFTAQLDRTVTDRGDEIGHMARDIDKMNHDLTDIVRQVRDGADTVSMSAAEISQANEDLAKRVQQEAAAVEETAATIEEMSSNVSQIAEHASVANELAGDTARLARQGGEVVEKAVVSMGKVSESSNKINDIIDVVNEIAFQTNLLALNASVEAARAGEAGRGFAVVAGEVRNLAGRSAEAAKEIQTLIKDSVSRVDDGNRMVVESGETLREIIAKVDQVAETVAEITAGISEQSTAIGEVNKAASQVDDVVQQNAALVEETAAASESLNSESSQLLDMMTKFTLTETRGPARTPAPPAQLTAPRPPAQGKPKPRPSAGDNQPTKPADPAGETDDFFSDEEMAEFEKF